MGLRAVTFTYLDDNEQGMLDGVGAFQLKWSRQHTRDLDGNFPTLTEPTALKRRPISSFHSALVILLPTLQQSG